MNHALGLLSEAEAQLRHVVEVAPLTWKTSPHYQGVLSVLSTVLTSQGKLEEALVIDENLCRQMKSAPGPSHPDTLVVMHNLADSYAKQDMLKDSESIQLEILNIQTMAEVPNMRAMLFTKRALALLYQRQSQPTAAANMWREIMRAGEQEFGLDHRIILDAKISLARILSPLGVTDEALKLLQEVLLSRLASLGPAHHYTIDAQVELASLYTSLGGEAEAEEIELDVLEACMEQPDVAGHDYTIAALQRLALRYQRQERWDAVIIMLQKEISLHRERNDPNKEELLLAVGNLAKTLEQKMEYGRAIQLWKEVVDGKVEALGEDHEHSIQAKEYLNAAESLLTSSN